MAFFLAPNTAQVLKDISVEILMDFILILEEKKGHRFRISNRKMRKKKKRKRKGRGKRGKGGERGGSVVI